MRRPLLLIRLARPPLLPSHVAEDTVSLVRQLFLRAVPKTAPSLLYLRRPLIIHGEHSRSPLSAQTSVLQQLSRLLHAARLAAQLRLFNRLLL